MRGARHRGHGRGRARHPVRAALGSTLLFFAFALLMLRVRISRPAVSAAAPADAARAARCGAKAAELAALHAAVAEAERRRCSESALLEQRRAEVTAAAAALAPLAEANTGLHLASFVQSCRQGVLLP